MPQSKNTGIWVAVFIAAVLAVLYYSNHPNTLFSVGYPTEIHRDFEYDHVPTIYDAGAGKGYVQVYPENLHIGDYSFPDNSIPTNIPLALNDHIKVYRQVT